MSRLARPSQVEVLRAERPHSNFDLVDDRFQGSYPIRRLFSQARSRGCRSIVIEEVPVEGAVADEVSEIAGLFPDYRNRGVYRLSFWASGFGTAEELPRQRGEDCLGYALLKHDECPSANVNDWHVFESVIVPYQHPHNFVPAGGEFEFRVGDSAVRVRGSPYCQQNGLNKACAQVALRSVCVGYLRNPELTFRQINDLAFGPGELRNPGAGLTTRQIERVLQGLGIPFDSFHYPALPPAQKWRAKLPYQKLVYSGVESGSGALLAFTLAGPKAGDVGHIVPIFGHTFNEDTWAPNAEGDYFQIGRQIRHTGSEAWLSSFIAHDDNFGSNLCIPKDYIRRKRADYAVALRPRGFEYSAYVAEIVASQLFYSLLPQVETRENRWRERLRRYVDDRKLILRTVPNTRADYLTHLESAEDWQGCHENPQTVRDIETLLPGLVWMVEVGIPDLFSTNKRKLGELLLDATRPYDAAAHFGIFVLARLPGLFAFFDRLDGRRHPLFLSVRSEIESHIPVQTVRAPS